MFLCMFLCRFACPAPPMRFGLIGKRVSESTVPALARFGGTLSLKFHSNVTRPPMREQPDKMFMLCCDESARVPYCKEGCKQGSDTAQHASDQSLRVIASKSQGRYIRGNT
jgi:hypothetical protein